MARTWTAIDAFAALLTVSGSLVRAASHFSTVQPMGR